MLLLLLLLLLLLPMLLLLLLLLLLLQLTLPQAFNGCEHDAEAARSAAVARDCQ